MPDNKPLPSAPPLPTRDVPTPGAPPAESTQPADRLGAAAQHAHRAIDILADSAAPRLQRLQDGMAATQQALHDRAERTRDPSRVWVDDLRGTVREHPLAALATAWVTALALGLLLARLPTRR